MAGIPQTVFERFQEPGGSRITHMDMVPGRQRARRTGDCGTVKTGVDYMH